jgi:hypothetical protein
MVFSKWARGRQIIAAVLGVGALWLPAACSGGQQKEAQSAADEQAGPPPPCRKDEVREYFCDDLLPVSSEKPAPEPYQTCPNSVGVKGNVFAPTSSWAHFDIPRTDWTRKRVPPGHACCYSWCSKLVVAEVDEIDVNACRQPNAMPERLCISTAEAGVSEAAPAPNEGCAAAVAPPPGVAFTPPKAAGLDLQATAEKRSQGLSECCYGWCSRAPLGTGLGAK